MSLDFTLFKDDNFEEEVFSDNITHNLTKMADYIGVYDALWRPEESGITLASQVFPVVRDGIVKMLEDQQGCELYEAENGWGTYKGFLRFLIDVCLACKEFPDSYVYASR